MLHTMRLAILALAFAGLGAIPTVSRGAVLVYRAEGVVRSQLNTSLAVGTPFEAIFGYDTLAPQIPGPVDATQYALPGLYRLTIGGVTLRDDQQSNGFIRPYDYYNGNILPPVPMSDLSLVARVAAYDSLGNPIAPVTAYVDFVRPGFWPSVSLADVPRLDTDFDLALARMSIAVFQGPAHFFDGPNHVMIGDQVQFAVTSVTLVPEPSSVWLLALSGVCLVVGRVWASRR